MKFKIICIGKMQKDSPHLKIIDEYKKRLCNSLKIVEIKSEKFPKEKKIDFEEKKISQHLSKSTNVIICDPNGKKITNKDLSNFILENNHFGVNELVFVVGGAFGIHKKILSKYTTFSFGELIWSHSLFRVMLTEQIYRSFCKINGHPYEK